MSDFYNPIVRTFGRLRSVLLRTLAIERRHICPQMPLAVLIPPEQRRQTWQRLREEGLAVPSLELTSWERTTGTLTVLKTAASLALSTQNSYALLTALPLGAVAYAASRPRAVNLPLGIRTVGDLVMYLTSYREHQHSGYRWTRNEIALRVRFLVAESMGLTLNEVQENTSFAELGAG